MNAQQGLIRGQERSQAVAETRASERVVAALLVLLGAMFMMLGTTWDIQWHGRVGRDSFWIPPHQVLYAGLLLAMLTVGAMLLRESWYPAGEPVRFGRFRLGRGLGMTGAGVATMLVAAPFDDLWHRLFGIDVTIWSPPHLMLIAGGALIIAGAVVELAMELRRGVLSRRVSGVAWIGLLLGFGLLLGPFSLSIQPSIIYSFLLRSAQSPFLYPLLAALVFPPVLFAARAATARRWGATTTALIALVLAIAANLFSGLGFALTFPNGIPNTGPTLADLRGIDITFVSRSRGMLFPLLHVAAALLLDLLAGRPGLDWSRLVLGAVGWSAALMGESLLIWFLLKGSLPVGQALLFLPMMALIATISAVIGAVAGRRITLGQERSA